MLEYVQQAFKGSNKGCGGNIPRQFWFKSCLFGQAYKYVNIQSTIVLKIQNSLQKKQQIYSLKQ